MPTAANPKTSKVTEEALIRRILYSSLPRDSPIPALLPIDDSIQSHREVDHAFSSLLAQLFREAILSWFSKLTPNRDLLQIITEILSRVIRKVHLRLNTNDGKNRILNMVRNELPNIFKEHYRDVKQSRKLLGTGCASVACQVYKGKGEIDFNVNPTELEMDTSNSDPTFTFESGSSQSRTIALLYYLSHPHPALSPTSTYSGQISVEYLASLLYEILLETLPEEDSKPDTEILITRDVLTGILRGTLSKCSRPWFITQSLNRVLDTFKVDRDFVIGNEQVETDARRELDATRKVETGSESTSTLLTTIFVSLERFYSIIRVLYLLLMPHVIRGYLEFFSTSKSSSNTRDLSDAVSLNSDSESRVKAFHLEGGDQVDWKRTNSLGRGQQSSDAEAPGGRRWSLWAARSTVNSNGISGSLSNRRGISRHVSRHGIVAGSEDETIFRWEDGALPSDSTLSSSSRARENDSFENDASKRVPQLLPQVVELIKEVMTLRERALGNQLANFIDLSVVLFGRKAEDLVVGQTASHLTPELFVSLINTTRESLLPNGHFGVAPPDPTPAQQVLEFERLKRRIWGITPYPLRILLLGVSTRKQEETIHNALFPICSPEAEGPMTHLAIKIMERISVLLVPELSAHPPSQASG